MRTLRRRLREMPFLALASLLAVVIFACTGRAGAGPEDVLNAAVDACSEVGVTGDLATCEARIRDAKQSCARLDGTDAAGCQRYLDELWAAATEGYHLARGECGALSSDQARSLCREASPVPQASPTAAVPGTVAPTPEPAFIPVMPRDNDGQDDNEGRGNRGGNGRDKKKEGGD